MVALSVVIITKNEEDILRRTLQSIAGVTDDIIIVDSGSTDNTTSIAKSFGTTLLETTWDGFGANKNKGIKLARYDWILSIDADELLNETLKNALLQTDFNDPSQVYELKFRTFIAESPLRYGQTSGEKHIRLFNKNTVHWNLAGVHEELIMPEGTNIILLPGHILHYSYKDLQDYIEKSNSYTTLRAMQMFQAGKKVSFFKLYLNPLYTFILNYFFRLGFLDGFWGYTYARLSSTYSYLKYAKLKELYAQKPSTFKMTRTDTPEDQLGKKKKKGV